MQVRETSRGARRPLKLRGDKRKGRVEGFSEELRFGGRVLGTGLAISIFLRLKASELFAYDMGTGHEVHSHSRERR